ncbi:helix-turn-helix transcriptional regulator [Consotaella aegiceratis]|uniref:helix-turn-helix transcriptional regulator n=1 Tax=Consotaella aegiceratis TaxID=3097961 RepID=UPI002F40D921
MSAEPPSGASLVEAGTIASASRIIGRGFQLGSDIPASSATLAGHYRLIRLRSGLHLHSSDAFELHDLETRIEQQPGLTVYLFLKGRVDAQIGGRPVMPPIGENDEGPRAAMMVRARPALFERHSRRGEHIRKVNVTVSPDWLADCDLVGADQASAVERFTGSHLAQRSWKPGRSMIAIAEQILNPPPYQPALQKLYLESRALELVAEGLAQLSHQSSCWATGIVGTRDQHRMRMIEEYLETRHQPADSLDDIARQAGLSVSTLQRLFHSVHGMSAFEWIRRRSLERARFALEKDGLSIAEAAHLAGYSNPANFSTAFKRLFGVSPKSVR